MTDTFTSKICNIFAYRLPKRIESFPMLCDYSVYRKRIDAFWQSISKNITYSCFWCSYSYPSKILHMWKCPSYMKRLGLEIIFS